MDGVAVSGVSDSAGDVARHVLRVGALDAPRHPGIEADLAGKLRFGVSEDLVVEPARIGFSVYCANAFSIVGRSSG
jgi:hypothetical protein